MKLQVRRFDPAAMKPHRIIVIIGKRSTGKSVLLQDLLYHFADRLDFGVAMTPTEDTAAMFREFLHPSWIHPGVRNDVIRQLLETQRAAARAQKRLRDVCLVMDDCMYDRKVLKTTEIRDIFMNGRHYHIMYITCVQYLMDLSPDLRTNVDYVFALKENIISNKVKLWKYFFGNFEKFDDFARVFDSVTRNFGVLVLDNASASNKLEETIFWYRATVGLPQKRIGKEIYWRLAAHCHVDQDEVARRVRAEAAMRAATPANKRITAVERHDADGNPVDEEITLVVN